MGTTRSNHLIGFLNFLTFLLSIPILSAGIWLSSRASAAAAGCVGLLQWPLILVGAAIMAVSLAGFVGACYRNTFLMYLYLWAMFFVVAALVGFTIFAYSVTATGSGRAVMGRAYMDYSLQDYAGTWLAGRIAGPGYWGRIEACVRGSGACQRLGLGEPAQLFYLRRLSPIQSGCCKPPTSCGYTYVNETFWAEEIGPTGPNPDCLRWSNEQEQLCYECGSCKAGVVASLQKSWRKVSIINVVVSIILVLVYVIACAAFRHNRQLDNDESYGHARMVKARPGWLGF
ncbi:Tetraspanin-3 [Striga hermonthica]|uniref:Tetraspanin-3 n=1 Tax=Striga hermonthica TaxID=68872 RepID=A0A9N7N2R6_STRHE|nr:Tetraspanin-3 [Striga hermonthica]